jgi:hypothetical protein
LHVHAVRQAHVELVEQLYRSTRIEDRNCFGFADEYINTALRDERARPLLDEIYGKTRDQIADLMDLSNVRSRRLTFVDLPTEERFSPNEALHLKPNIFGFGFNVNYIWKWVKTKWQSRRKRGRRAT